MSAWNRLAMIAAITLISAGCAVDRPWFQMNSNSPMPFFGFDVMPRRSAMVDGASEDQSLVVDNHSETPVQQANSKSPEMTSRTLHLKAFSNLLDSEEEFALTEPEAP